MHRYGRGDHLPTGIVLPKTVQDQPQALRKDFPLGSVRVYRHCATAHSLANPHIDGASLNRGGRAGGHGAALRVLSVVRLHFLIAQHGEAVGNGRGRSWRRLRDRRNSTERQDDKTSDDSHIYLLQTEHDQTIRPPIVPGNL